MKAVHSEANRLALHRKIEQTHGALLNFVVAHRSSRLNPWTKEEAKEHNRLLKDWLKAVEALSRFEHPGGKG